MASSSSTGDPLLGLQVIEKLSRQNHAIWSVQVLATIRGARLERFITGKAIAPDHEVDEKLADGKMARVSNPAYQEWYASDQQVLGFLFSSLTRGILAQVAAKTVAEAWTAISDMFASHTRARTVYVRLALATTKKEAMTISRYYVKMKALGDEMAASGKPLDDEELVSYIINGLDHEYNPVTSALLTRVEPISLSELYSQLLSFETRLELQQGGSSSSSVNSAGRGNRSSGQQRGRGGRSGFGHGSGSGRGRGQQGRSNYSNQQQRKQYNNIPSQGANGRPRCQVCFKPRHMATDCWHRFDENYVPEERHVAAATCAHTL